MAGVESNRQSPNSPLHLTTLKAPETAGQVERSGDSDKGTRVPQPLTNQSALSWRGGYRGKAITVSIWIRLNFSRFAKGSS